jgi:RimJ/RimL family protein N-acetyltransferase
MSLTHAPRLETARLVLRGPEPSDAEPIVAFLMDHEHGSGFGTYDNRGDAWRWFATNIGHWHLHGYGYFTVVQGDGTAIGLCGIWNPEGWPEPELGWALFRGYTGQGFAQEAAERARRWAYATLGLTTLTSNILPDNAPSKALAERLGARYERTYTNITMGKDELWRHPGPGAIA